MKNKHLQASEEFYAKIMLFGEYSIICNSMGLTMPYDEYKGKLTFIGLEKDEDIAFARKSNKHLYKYSKYLASLVSSGDAKFEFDIEQLKSDIENGLYFQSNIPQGFGVGSSGALVAAIYDRYAINKLSNKSKLSHIDIAKLKEILGQMESYFHGKSSGLDPLNCYVNQPLLIKNISEIDEVGLPGEKNSKEGMFLIDTGNPGKTEPLVKYFLDQCNEESFFTKLKSDLIPNNDSAIKSFIKGEMKEFYNSVKSLSKFLLYHLTPMIPTPFIEIWKKGLETSAYYLKLCGSGGGGYLLGFAEDLEKAKEELEKMQVKIIPLSQKTKA